MDDFQSLVGRLLVAMPGIGDPRFEHAVILICAHGPDHAMGLRLDRPAPGVNLKKVLNKLDTAAPEAAGKRQATLIASGSEVILAVEARKKLAEAGIQAAVVSMPSWELFDAQPESYRKQVLGDGVRVACEAAGMFGWERYVGEKGATVGMTGFGASAPAPALYKHFGITADAIVAAVKARL